MDPLDGILGCVTFVVILFNHGCQSDGLIGPTPANKAVLIGDTHRYNCSRESGVSSLLSWYDDIPGIYDIQLYVGTLRLTTLSKYSNFAFEADNEDKLDLIISNVTIEDEGTYICELAGTYTRQAVTLTVEVASSSLHMTQDGDDAATVSVKEGKLTEVVCTAVGARPAVDIWWYHLKTGEPEQRIMTGVTQTNTSIAGCTFNTVSTLQYTANREYRGGRLRCKTTGQDAAPSMEDVATLNVLHAPEIKVSFKNSIVYCSSDANPAVADDDYVIIINDTFQYTPTCTNGKCALPLEATAETHVRCNATNVLGTRTSDLKALPDAVRSTTPPPIATETYPNLPDVDFSALCTSNFDDANIIIIVNGRTMPINSEIALPSSGCLTIECTAIRGSYSNSRKSKICTAAESSPGVSIVIFVVVPLAIIAIVSIAFALVFIMRTRQRLKGQCGKDESNSKNAQSDTAEPHQISKYMELDARTREMEKAYQKPQQPSPTYEEVAKDVQYQEISGNFNKEYYNIPLTS